MSHHSYQGPGRGYHPPPPPRDYQSRNQGYDDRERASYAPPPPAQQYVYDSYSHGHGHYEPYPQQQQSYPQQQQQYPQQRHQGYEGSDGRHGAYESEAWERGREQGELPPANYTHASENYNTSSAPPRGPPSRRSAPKPLSDESSHVIFLGIDPDMHEAALAEFLRNDHKASIESTTIIRDKISGISKGFGFAAFTTLDGAKAFVQANYPLVTMPPTHPNAEPRRAKIDYSGTHSTAPDAGAGYASGPGARAASKLNDGTRDIGSGGDGNRVLLLRGLDVETRGFEVVNRIGEEIDRLVERVERKVGGLEGRRAVQRVVIIADRSTRVGWGFAFVEFFHPGLATHLLSHLQSPVSQPRGFVMPSAPHRPVAATFANPASFSPIDPSAEGSTTEGCVQASGPGGIGGGAFSGWCAYWDERAEAGETLGVKANGQADELLAKYLDKIAPPPPVTSALTGASREPMVQELQKTGPISIGLGAGGSKGKMPEVGMIPIVEKRKANVLGDDDEEEDLVGKDFELPSRTKGVKMIPTMATSKKISKNISKWNNKQAELAKPKKAKGLKEISTANAAQGAASKWNQTTSTTASSSTIPTPPPVASQPVSPSTQAGDDVDYTDNSTLALTGKVACLLCQRQFKTEDVLRKHVSQSDLHKARMTNLADFSVCELGAKRKAAAVAAAADPDTAKKYRDRAAERRTVFNQSSAPVQEVSTSKRPGPAAPPKPEVALEPGKDETNVGNQLLAKMGWTAGTGLGLESDGRVAPVIAQQFENRAGLGASTGREAGKYSGAEGYRTMAKDMAKSRYESSESK